MAVSDDSGRNFTLLLVGLLTAGVALRFYGLGSESLWFDEVWTAASTDPGHSLSTWLERWVLPDVHPPLYLLLLRTWRELFGNDEATLRLLSVLLSLPAIAAIPLMQRRMAFTQHPLMFATLLACSFGAIVYAQEVRAYAFVVSLGSIAIILTAAIAERLRRSLPIRLEVMALCTVLVVAEFTHYFGALLAFGAFGALVVTAALYDRRRLPQLLIAGLGVIAVFLPWIVLHSQFIADKTGGQFWITNAWSSIFSELTRFTVGTTWAFLLLISVCALAFLRRPQQLAEPGVFVPVLVLALVVVGAAVISLHTPIVTARNLLIVLPALYLVFCRALGSLADASHPLVRRIAPAVMPLVAATSLAFAAEQVVSGGKQQWREAAAFVASLPGCESSTLAVTHWNEAIYAYYLPPHLHENLRTIALDETVPQRSPVESNGDCPLVLWSGHISAGDHEQALKKLDAPSNLVTVTAFRGHRIALRLSAAGSGRSAAASTPQSE